MKAIYKALADFQQEVPVIHEDTKGYNYTYANLGKILETIKPLLKKHGLGFYQALTGDGLQTRIFHIETAEELISFASIPKAELKGMNAYQSLGSGITYLRRYSLSCMLGLITDKDIDAAGETKPKKKALPKLETVGYQYLMTEGNTKEVTTALKTRSMQVAQREALEEQLIKLNK